MIACAIKKFLEDKFNIERKRLDDLEKNEPITIRGLNIPFMREQAYIEGYLTALSHIDKYKVLHIFIRAKARAAG